MQADSHIIESKVTSFIVNPTNNLLSDFEGATVWTSLLDGMDTAVEHPTILLNQKHLPADGCLALVAGIVAGTTSIVSDGSFNLESLIGPAGTSAVVLTPSTNCQPSSMPSGIIGLLAQGKTSQLTKVNLQG